MNELRPADRLAELLMERLERKLSAEEERELNCLLEKDPSWREDDFELAAAATFMAFHGPPVEALPPELAACIAAESPARPLRSDAPVRERSVSSTGGASVGVRSRFFVRYAGWWAAAACSLLTFYLWQRPPAPEPRVAQERGTEAGPRVKTSAELRAELLRRPGVIRREWKVTQDALAAGVSGDVVWHPATQTGYMRFRDLPANDARRNQYQLWIFDAERDERHPVDGGVFDIRAENRDAVVAIDAKLKVHRATLFAVTLEEPGGVVVSSRERLLTLAKVDG